MTVVILAHGTDAGASLVAASLRRDFGPDSIQVIRPETLCLGQWSHRIRADGKTTTRLELPAGRVLSSTDIGVVLNRIHYLPAPRFHRAPAKDRDYAGSELHALVLSWLNDLGDRVVNSVRRHPWITPMLPLQHWAVAAAGAGLPVAERRIASSTRAIAASGELPPARSEPGVEAGTVLIAGSRADGVLASRYGDQCMAAANVLGFSLIEFQFAFERGETALAGVNPLPNLAEPSVAAMTADLIRSRLTERAS
jgi:hypothetical protein